MEINVQDDRQLVEIWLTNAEKNDLAVRERLKPVYPEYKKKKYLVAVYESGNRPLYQSILDLLAYNRRRSAELDARQYKQHPQS